MDRAAVSPGVQGVKVAIGKDRGDHVDMYYELHGNGPEKVLFITGFATPCSAWHRTVAALQPVLPNHQFLLPDNRGAGLSSAGVQRCTTTAMALDLVELLRILDWHEVHVVGLSMGGMIAQEFAFAYGFKRIKTLSFVVTSTGGGYPTLNAYVAMARSLFLPRPEDRAPVILPILYSNEFLSRKVGERIMQDIITEDWVMRTKNAGPPSNLFGQMRAVSTHHVDDKRLLQIKTSGVPLLIVCAEKDDLVRAHHSHRMAALLRPAEFIEFKGAGHLVHIECMEEFNAALMRHWKRAVPNASL